MNIECILFDLDNTLIGIPNTWQYFDQIIQKVVNGRYNLPIPTEEQRNQLWRSGKEYVSILQSWGIHDADNFWCLFDEIDGIQRKKLIQEDKLILYSDVLPTLTRLKDDFQLKLGIVTNTPNFIAKLELENYQLEPYFEAFIGLGEDQSICKPEPTGIQQIIEKLNVSPSNTLFVGDSAIDLLAGIRAKVKPILIDRSGNKRSGLDEINPQQYSIVSTLVEIFSFLI